MWCSTVVSAAPPPQVQQYWPTSASASELAETLATRDEQSIDALDRWHDQWFMAVQTELERFDHRQAKSTEAIVPVPISPFRIGLDARLVDTLSGTSHDLAGDFDISLQLPNLQTRLNLFLTTDSLDERSAVEEWESVRAGLRLDLPQSVDLEVGARLSTPLSAFVALRWGDTQELGKWTAEPFTKVFLETDDGAGASASLALSRWQDRWLLRSSGSVRWLAETDTTNWSQALLLAKVDRMLGTDRFSSRNRGRDLVQASGLRIEASGERLSRVDAYQASLLFKRPLHSNWLFWSVEPLLRFERRSDWRADPGIRLGIDMLFWDLAAR